MKSSLLYCVIIAIIFLNAVFSVNGQTSPQAPAANRCGRKWRSYVMSLCSIIKRCKRTATCMEYPDAKCRFVHDDCGKCVEKFYIGRNEVICNEQCPADQPAQECSIPACEYVECDDSNIKNSQCRSSRCGKCHALFRNGGNDWRECAGARYVVPRGLRPPRRQLPEAAANSIQRASVRSETRQRGRNNRPVDVAEIISCPDNAQKLQCDPGLCTNGTCARYPEARCIVDNCGVCHADWVVGKMIVNCNQGHRIWEKCPDGAPALPNCNPCRHAYCENYPDAQCRINDCGKCKAEFYVNNRKVQCRTPPNYIDACPVEGDRRYYCPSKMCRFHVCPYNHRVYCTIDNCGGCRAVYRFKWTNDVTVCNGYWSQFEESTAREGYPVGPQLAGTRLDPVIAELERQIREEQAMFQAQINSGNQGPVNNQDHLDPHAGHGHNEPLNTNIQQEFSIGNNVQPEMTNPRAGFRNEVPSSQVVSDPHAGHGHTQEQNTRTEVSNSQVVADPHAGHGHAQQQNTRTGIPISQVVADPHAGHGHAQQQNIRTEIPSPPVDIDFHSRQIGPNQAQDQNIHGEPAVSNVPLNTNSQSDHVHEQAGNREVLGQQIDTIPTSRPARPRTNIGGDRLISQTNTPQSPRLPNRNEQQPPQANIPQRPPTIQTREQRQQNRIPRPQRPSVSSRPERTQSRIPSRQERQQQANTAPVSTLPDRLQRPSVPTRPERPQSRIPSGEERQQQANTAPVSTLPDRPQRPSVSTRPERPQSRIPSRGERQRASNRDERQRPGSPTRPERPVSRIPPRQERQRATTRDERQRPSQPTRPERPRSRIPTRQERQRATTRDERQRPSPPTRPERPRSRIPTREERQRATTRDERQRPSAPTRPERPRSRIPTREERQRATTREQRPSSPTRPERPRSRIPTREERPGATTREQRQRTSSPTRPERPRARIPTGEERQRPGLPTRSERPIIESPARENRQQQILQNREERQRTQTGVPQRPNGEGRSTSNTEPSIPPSRLPTISDRQSQTTLTIDHILTHNENPREQISTGNDQQITNPTSTLQASEQSVPQMMQEIPDRTNIRTTSLLQSDNSANVNNPVSGPQDNQQLPNNNPTSIGEVLLSSSDTRPTDASSNIIQTSFLESFNDFPFPLFDLFNMPNTQGIPISQQQMERPVGA